MYKKYVIIHLMARCHSFNILLVLETVFELAIIFCCKWNCSTSCYIARAEAKLPPIARAKGECQMTVTCMVMSTKFWVDMDLLEG